MNPELAATALIAEDEPLLAQALQSELQQAWPALRVVATVGNGLDAVRQTLALQPQVLFFDIRMPGLGGLEAAAALLEEWPQNRPFPALVFVTAYDQYAMQAFDAQAIDYVLKPVDSARLRRTLARIQSVLPPDRPDRPDRPNGPVHDRSTDPALDRALEQVRRLLQQQAGAISPAEPPLRHIQAGVGTAIRLIPVEQVLYFEAADKYVRVLSPGHEDLIRTPLRELLPRLDPGLFWQVHRGTVVRVSAIEQVVRDASGKLTLQLRGSADRLVVSRLYAHLFKAM